MYSNPDFPSSFSIEPILGFLLSLQTIQLALK